METPVVASNTPTGTGTTCPSTVPTHQEDDILIAQFGWRGNQNATVLTGWNHYFTSPTGTASNGCTQGLWWRRVAPAETVTAPTLTIGTTAVERKSNIVRIRGADIDNPANTFWQKQQTVGNNASPTPPGVSLPAPLYQLLHFVTCRGNSAVTQPTDYTELADVAEGTTLCVEVSFKDQLLSGSVSGQAASISSNRWVAAILAIPSPDFPYFRSQTSTTATDTSVTGTLPTGTTDVDFYGRADGMLALVKAAGSGIAITPGDSINWVNVPNWDIDTSTGSDSIEVFFTEYASGRSLLFSRPTSGVISVQLLTYRNIHQTAFIGNASAKTQAGTPSTFDAQARQNTKSTVVSAIVADADTNNVHTAPSGFTEHSDGLGIGTADQIFDAGGTTPSGSWVTTNAANVVGLIELLSHAGVVAQVQAPRTMHMMRMRRI